MCEQLNVDVLTFQHIYLDSMNREQTEYLLDKETCLCLVAGYNAKLRMAIIKRWQQLNLDVLTFQHIYLDSMNLTLSMANFHSPKLGSATIPMNKMGKP